MRSGRRARKPATGNVRNGCHSFLIYGQWEFMLVLRVFSSDKTEMKGTSTFVGNEHVYGGNITCDILGFG